MKDTLVHGCRLAQSSYKTAPELFSAKPTFSWGLKLLCRRNWPNLFQVWSAKRVFSAYVSVVSTAFRVVVDLTKCRICELKCTKLRMVAGIRPDLEGELERSYRLPSHEGAPRAVLGWAGFSLPNFFTLEPGLLPNSDPGSATGVQKRFHAPVVFYTFARVIDLNCVPQLVKSAQKCKISMKKNSTFQWRGTCSSYPPLNAFDVSPPPPEMKSLRRVWCR